MISTALSNDSLFYEILSSEIKSFLIDVPYTSISQFYEYYENQHVDSRFGVSCVFQSYAFGKLLESKGICDVSYYVDGRHVALLCSAEGETFLIDPYLLHTSPIEIRPKAINDHSDTIRSESYAYPYRKQKNNNKPSKLSANYYPEFNKVRLTYKKYSPCKEHYVISRMFTLDLNCTISSSPPSIDVVKPLLHHGEQNNLSIRMLHRKEHLMYELIYPIALYHSQAIDEGYLIARNNNGQLITTEDKSSFKSIINRMTESLECSESTLISFVLGGVAIYEKHAPKHIEYATLQMKDE